MSSDAIVDMPTGLDIWPVSNDSAKSAVMPIDAARPDVQLSTIASVEKSYSDADFALFQALTGYRLAALDTMWVVVDDDGKRAPFADRLFTTLAEEAFRFADRRRRAGTSPDDDLTLGDLLATLGPLQRVASEIGSRGVIAFQRLEAAFTAHNQMPATAFEIPAVAPAS